MAKFAKGQSGNPSGRPKAVKDVQDMCRSLTPAVVRVLADIVADPAADVRGRVAASKELLDRAWGKATAKIEADVTVLDGLATAIARGRDRARGRDKPADPVQH